MKIVPLRSMVLVRYLASPNGSKLHVVEAPRSVKRATVLAVGPECREVRVEMCVLVQSAAATQVGDEALIPEHAIVALL